MKNKKNKVLAVIIFLAGALVSFLILQSGKEKESDYLFQIEGDSFTNPAFNFIKTNQKNLTEEFTNKSIEKLVEENTPIVEGETGGKIKTLPNEKSISEVIDSIIEEELSSEKISEEDIRINEDDSKNIQISYIFFINSLLKKTGEQIRIKGEENISVSEQFTFISNEFADAFEILKLVKTPPSWKDIHIEILSFLLRQRNIYASLAAGESDPLRYMIAIKRVSEGADRKFEEINRDIAKKMEESFSN